MDGQKLSSTLTIEDIVINSIDVTYAHDSSISICFWTDEKYRYKLTYPSELGKEYMQANIGKLIVDYVVYPEDITEPYGLTSSIYPQPQN